MRVGLLTTQFPDFTRAGGIAPPTARLARHVAAEMGECTVLLCRTERSPDGAMIRRYRESGIDLVTLDVEKHPFDPWWLQGQSSVRRQLESMSMDVVVAQEWHGLASLLTVGPPVCGKVVTWLHGGSMYDAFGGGRALGGSWQGIESELERIQVETSDVVVSPSKFLPDWYRSQGWSIPPDTCRVIRYHIETPPAEELARAREESSLALVFVGQLSRRKGLDRFFRVLEENRHLAPRVHVKIFGSPTEFPVKQVQRSLARLGFQGEVVAGLNTSQIWSRLTHYRTLLLAPSRLDNSPNTVYEAAVRGHHAFVWPANGAVELEEVFKGRVHAFTTLDEAISESESDRVMPLDIGDVNSSITGQWLEIFGNPESDRGFASQTPGVSNRHSSSNDCSVSIVIASRGRCEFLLNALRSMNHQVFRGGIEIVVVDDHSEIPYEEASLAAAAPSWPVHLIRNARQQGPSESRNIGASRASHPLLVFADDDNYLEPNHIQSLVTEWSRSGSPVVVAGHLHYETEEFPGPDTSLGSDSQVVFAGSHLMPLGLLHNVVGDTNFLIERTYFESVGRWDPAIAGTEDWEFLIRCTRSRSSISATMIPTVHYRRNQSGLASGVAWGPAMRQIDLALQADVVDPVHILGLCRALMHTSDAELPVGRALQAAAHKFRRGFKRNPVRTLRTTAVVLMSAVRGAR